MLYSKSKKNCVLVLLFCIIGSLVFGNNEWKKTKGKAIDIAVDGKGRVFIVNDQDRQVYSWNVFDQDWDKVIKTPNNVSKVAAAKDGLLYSIIKGKVYQYKAKKWTAIGNIHASDIGVGANGALWSVSKTRKIAKWSTKRKKWLILKTTNTKIAGKKPRSIDVDKSGNPFVTFFDNSIAYYISARKKWKVLPGKAIDIACSNNGYAYIIGPKGNIHWWNTKKQQWEKHLDKGPISPRRLSMLPNNTPWVATQKGGIYHRVKRTFSKFLPSKHGFHFSNSFLFNATLKFKFGIFDSFIPEKYYKYNIRESYGLCGGMAFGAHEYFLQNRAIPTDTETPKKEDRLYKYLLDRLYVSFGNGPGFPNLRKALGWWGSFEFKTTLLEKDTREEMPKIIKKLDQKKLVQLILIYKTKTTGSPWDNHQVLAYGYEQDYSTIRLFVYDPNRPDNDKIVITYTKKGNGKYALFQNGYQQPKKIFGLFPIYPKVEK